MFRIKPGKTIRIGSLCFICVILLRLGTSLTAQVHKTDVQFPVEAEIFVDEPFAACEGITFNGEGDLYVTANKAL